MLKLSLIIPVYNEERHIKACLDAVAAQTVMPDEVIIVDNNCTDRTVEIAQQYEFVTVVREEKQGRGHARSAGFDAAKHEILGRIDADTVLDLDWTEHVKQRFIEDESLAGLTGLGKTSFIPGVRWLKTKLFSRGYFWYMHSDFRTITMWGANMAIAASAWALVKESVVKDDSQVHEDQDISLWIAASGGKILQDNSMMVTADGQTYISVRKLFKYRKLYHQTKDLHERNGNLSKTTKLPFSLIRLLLGYMVTVLGVLVLLLGLVTSPFRPR